MDYQNYHLIKVSRSSSQTISISYVPHNYNECHIIIYNSASSNITITLPSSVSRYTVRKNVSSITIAAGTFGEINVLRFSTELYIRAV